MATEECKIRCLRMESLPREIVEGILERLPVKSLLRFKAVSNQWRSTIESRLFQERQLAHRQQSGDLDVLMVSDDTDPDIAYVRTLVFRFVFGSSSSSVKIPTHCGNKYYIVSQCSLDGLVCLYDPHKSGFVVNPTTRWYRPLPLCGLQQLVNDLGDSYLDLGHELFQLGFGKDIFTGTYKPVWLYNSSELGLENATTCEVFDFSTNAWRYVTPSAPSRIFGCPAPVFVDGSLHWLTDCEETKVVSFDLHTEAFQVISKAPFAKVRPYVIFLCNLDNRLCVSRMKCPNQVIWSFNSGNKTWDKIYSIDLDLTYLLSGVPSLCALYPLALFDGEKTKKKKKKKKKKLMFYDPGHKKTLMIHDPETKSYDIAFSAESIGNPVCYFPSLISIS